MDHVIVHMCWHGSSCIIDKDTTKHHPVENSSSSLSARSCAQQVTL